MDFAFSPEQEALRDLARKILEDHVTPERLKAVDADADRFDRTTWSELARARLLGTAIPEAHGGSGLGLIELCLLLEQVGRTVAPVPAWPTLVLGALPIAEFGTRAQQAELLPAVASGELILTAALVEPGSEDPRTPTTTARRDGNAWRLDGMKTCVPAAHLAGRILVPARTDQGTALFLIDPQSSGVTPESQLTTNYEPQARLTLVGAPAAPLGDARAVAWLHERALVGLCAMQLGVASRAVQMTGEYTNKREQFGRPLASFQAVHQRAADAYIDVEAMRVTLWQAAWRLAEGLPASAEVAVAKFWASEGSHRAVYAAQHLHGGIGVDMDYPLYRYYLWSKQIELSLGSSLRQLARIGEALAATRPTADRSTAG